MREVRKKQKTAHKYMKVLVIFSVIFIFVFIGAQPYLSEVSKTLSVAINYICDILVLASLVYIFVYYTKYGKVEPFMHDIENELEDAGYYISARVCDTPTELTKEICADLTSYNFKISKDLDVKDFTFDLRAFKGSSYIYLAEVESLDKNDILAYLDEMVFDLTSNCFKRKGDAVMCFVTDKADGSAIEVSKMITRLGRKGQLKIALAIAETDTGNVYFQGNEETKTKTLISKFVMHCDLPLEDKYIHKGKMQFQLDLEDKVKSFTVKDFNSGKFYIH